MHGRNQITVLIQADTDVIRLVQGLEANHYASVVSRHGDNDAFLRLHCHTLLP